MLIAALLLQSSEIDEALKRLADVESYAFTETIERTGEDAEKAEGRISKDAGLVMKYGDREIVRVGDRTAYRGDDGWTTQTKGGLRFSLGPRDLDLMTYRTPHERLSTLKLSEVKSADDTERVGDVECVVFEGEFEAPRQKGEFTFTIGPRVTARTVKLWVDDAYRLRKAVMTEEMGDVKTTRTFEFSDIGETAVEIPEEARKALER